MQKRDFIQTALTGVVFIFSIALIQPILSPYIESMGYSNVTISIIFSLFPLTLFLWSPIAGNLSDIIGRRSVVRMGIALALCAFMFYILGHGSFLMTAVARILNAAAFATVSFVIMSRVHDLVDNAHRGAYSGVYLSLERLAFMLGPLAGGFIADTLFLAAPFYAGITVMSLLLFTLFLRAPNKRFAVSRKDLCTFKELRTFLSYPRLRGLSIIGMATQFTNAAYIVFVPLYVIEAFPIGYKAAGIAMFAFQVPQLLQFVTGKVADRLGRRVLIIIGSILKAGMFYALAVPTTFTTFLMLYALAGFGSSMWNVSAFSLLSDKGEEIGKEGAFTTSYVSLIKIGGFLSFLISGVFVQAYSIEALFRLDAAIIIVGIVLSLYYLFKPLDAKMR